MYMFIHLLYKPLVKNKHKAGSTYLLRYIYGPLCEKITRLVTIVWTNETFYFYVCDVPIVKLLFSNSDCFVYLRGFYEKQNMIYNYSLTIFFQTSYTVWYRPFNFLFQKTNLQYNILNLRINTSHQTSSCLKVSCWFERFGLTHMLWS